MIPAQCLTLTHDNTNTEPTISKEKEKGKRLNRSHNNSSDSSAKYLTPTDDNTNTEPTTSKGKKLNRNHNDDDWMCGVCSKSYFQDVQKRNGAKWIQCSFCLVPYHIKCLAVDDDDDEKIFRCDTCCENEIPSDSSDSE